MRDHDSVVIEEFNGWWSRGEDDSVPPDHFTDCNNVQYIHSGVRTRDGLDTYIPQRDVVRIYTYVRQDGESLLVLDTLGQLWHCSPTFAYLILTIPAMTDFGFVGIDGRAYITPCDSRTGLKDEFLYVYKGDGTAARKAGGEPPRNGSFTATENPAVGFVETGIHIFAVVYETDTGFLTSLGPLDSSDNPLFASVNATGARKVDLTNIPISPNSYVVARHIYSTKAIEPDKYTGNLEGYQFFKVPGSRIANNTDVNLTVSFFDADLLEDGSSLFDLFSEIPAGVGLTTYHGRLVSWAEHDNISLARVSSVGEPESINQIDGLMIAPLDGNPLTNFQEFRDVLYGYKKTRTYAWNDGGDVPSTWPLQIVDQGIGASVHGISTVLDSGGVNIDFLVIVDYSGIILFNGSYIRPELTWKIADYWLSLDRDFFYNIQIVNDSLSQTLYITLPNKQMIIGNYSNGMDAQKIRWAKWSFDVETTTITLIEINKLIIGSRQVFSGSTEQIPVSPDQLQEI